MEKLEKIPPLKLQVKSPCPSTYAGKKVLKNGELGMYNKGAPLGPDLGIIFGNKHFFNTIHYSIIIY